MAILKNAIRCTKCNDVVVSEIPHQDVYCSCGLVAADGGGLYIRRIGRLGKDFEELLERDRSPAPEIYVDYAGQEAKRAHKQARKLAEEGGPPEVHLVMMTEMVRMREKIESLEKAAAAQDSDYDAGAKAQDDEPQKEVDAASEKGDNPEKETTPQPKKRGMRADVSRLGG